MKKLISLVVALVMLCAWIPSASAAPHVKKPQLTVKLADQLKVEWKQRGDNPDQYLVRLYAGKNLVHQETLDAEARALDIDAAHVSQPGRYTLRLTAQVEQGRSATTTKRFTVRAASQDDAAAPTPDATSAPAPEATMTAPPAASEAPAATPKPTPIPCPADDQKPAAQPSATAAAVAPTPAACAPASDKASQQHANACAKHSNAATCTSTGCSVYGHNSNSDCKWLNCSLTTHKAGWLTLRCITGTPTKAPETTAPVATPTPIITTAPTAAPTPIITTAPTAAPTPIKTATPTAAPTPIKTAAPTPTPVRTPAPTAVASPTPIATPSGDAMSALADEVVRQVNAERAKAGLGALKVDAELTRAACVRAQEIVQTFSHTRPSGQSWSTVSDKAFGENIAYGQSSADRVMAAWMSSEGHRANILRSSFGSIGVCAYKVGNVIYWAQLFGR